MNSIFYFITLVVSSWKDENLKLVTVQEKKKTHADPCITMTYQWVMKKKLLLRVTVEYSLAHQRHENLFFKNPLVIWFNFLLCIYCYWRLPLSIPFPIKDVEIFFLNPIVIWFHFLLCTYSWIFLIWSDIVLGHTA